MRSIDTYLFVPAHRKESKVDVLSDVLDLLQLRGTLYFRTAFSSPWSVAVPAHPSAARFHLCVQGRCHVIIDGKEAVDLDPGDLILIPNGVSHVLCDTPDTAPATLDDVLTRSGFSGEGVLTYGGEPHPHADTKLVCGHFTFAPGADHPLVRALPDYLLVTAEVRARAPLLDDLMRLITRQMFAPAAGVTASVIRLSEALFIEVIRCCTDQDEALCNVIEAIGDPRIGQALGLMHRGLEKSWTLENIARDVGMSRSRFSERFQTMMGCAPMSYLSDLRLQKAMNLLAGTGDPIQIIASQVGYQSPAAFSRAFTNRYGRSPRDARRAVN
jgi:AraC-like DNA-binding protein